MVRAPEDTGMDLHLWAQDLFPIGRSITGNGVRETLAYLSTLMPDLQVHEVPSGTAAFDWVVPDEWNIRSAYLEDMDGTRWLDYEWNTLHVLGYSEPVDRILTRTELEQHLHSLPNQPDAIPYVTSYYQRTWGLCLTQRQKESLPDGPFRVVIDSELAPGHITYGELVIQGETTDEVLLSTYICHPSMANNELSGPVVATGLARWIREIPNRRFTYRILFVPETIGSILYISQHLDHLRTHVRAGWVLTCIGDNLDYSYLPSRTGDTLADRVSLSVIRDLNLPCTFYSYLDRGSDERQYCSPGVDLPVASLMRTKYGQYPEYHTSLDNLDFVTPDGLQGGLDMMVGVISALEGNRRWRSVFPCEPQLGRRGLYPTTSTATSGKAVREMMNVLAYLDGTRDTLSIAETCHLRLTDVHTHCLALAEAGLIEEVQ